MARTCYPAGWSTSVFLTQRFYFMPNVTRLAAQATLAVLKELLVRLEPGDRSWLARNSVSARDRSDVRALVDFGYGTIRGWKNSEYDIKVNGEAALLERLRPGTMLVEEDLLVEDVSIDGMCGVY